MISIDFSSHPIGLIGLRRPAEDHHPRFLHSSAEPRRPVLSGAERVEVKENAQTALVKLPLQALNDWQITSRIADEGVVHRCFYRV